tara:strand:- start:300 stop:638 length:339 start_codon:yes stop_codon:yes gene_type:complete
MSGKETTKELIEQILLQQESRNKSDKLISSNIAIIIEKQEQQIAFNQKISSLLFNDSDTSRDGYIANQDDLNKRVLLLETKNKITAGKIGISVIILSGIGTFFFWLTSFVWK